jgi:hypothetical protein
MTFYYYGPGLATKADRIMADLLERGNPITEARRLGDRSCPVNVWQRADHCPLTAQASTLCETMASTFDLTNERSDRDRR